MTKNTKELMEEIRKKFASLNQLKEAELEVGDEYKDKISADSMDKEEKEKESDEEEKKQDEKIAELETQIEDLKKQVEDKDSSEGDQESIETDNPQQKDDKEEKIKSLEKEIEDLKKSLEDDSEDDSGGDHMYESDSGDNRKSFSTKDDWYAAAKKYGYRLSFWGHGSVDALDTNEDEVGTWISEFDTHNGTSPSGYLIIKTTSKDQKGARVSPKRSHSISNEQVDTLFLGNDLSEETKIQIIKQFNESVNKKVEVIKSDLEDKYKKMAKVAKRKVLEEAKVVDEYAKYLKQIKEHSVVRANVNSHREMIKESMYKDKIKRLDRIIESKEELIKGLKSKGGPKMNLRVLKENAKRFNGVSSRSKSTRLDEMREIESRREKYLAERRDQVVNESMVLSEYDQQFRKSDDQVVDTNVKGIVDFFNNQF